MKDSPMAEDELEQILDTFMNKVFEIGSFYEKPTQAVLGDRHRARHKAKAAINAYTTNKIIEELENMLGHAREHTITDIEMVMHHSGNTIDFIEGVDTRHFENRLAELKGRL